MVYIDFDDVILATESVLFEQWRKNPNCNLLLETDKIKYIQNSDWNYILNHSEIINDSIYYLSQMDPKISFILTKVHSLVNEGVSKVEWVRKHGIRQNVIMVPYRLRKTDVVDASNNILVDDCLKNLDDWVSNGGIPIFFDINDDNYDNWMQQNVRGYEKVLSLSSLTRHF